MKHILLSADGLASLYEVPDKTAENLHKYCLDFCKWIDNGPKAQQFRKEGYYPEEEFINYLNTVVNPNYIYKSRYIKTIEDSMCEIPEKYKDLPYFNF